MRRTRIQPGGLAGWLGMGLLSLALVGWTPAANGNEPQPPQREADPAQEAGASTETRFLSSGSFIGLEVRNFEGKKVGKVYDILLNGQEKTAPMMVLSFGGLFGIGDELYAVPWKAVGQTREAGYYALSVPIAPESPASAPIDWIALEESYSTEEERFAQGPYGLKKTEGEEEGVRAPSPDTTPLVSANQLLNSRFLGADSREDVGGLNDLLIGAEMGRLACGVVTLKVGPERGAPDVGGIADAIDPQLGVIAPIERKSVAIPITLMELDASELLFVSNVGTQTIYEAPHFEITRQEQMEGVDRSRVEEVFRYFGENLNQLGEEDPSAPDSSVSL